MTNIDHDGSPTARLIEPRDWLVPGATIPGTSLALMVGEHTPGAAMRVAQLSVQPATVIPVHYHDVPEFQLVVSGHGAFIDCDGVEHPVGPWSAVFAPPGIRGAHGFRNDSSVAMIILFVYVTPGGASPPLHRLDHLRAVPHDDGRPVPAGT